MLAALMDVDVLGRERLEFLGQARRLAVRRGLPARRRDGLLRLAATASSGRPN